MQINRTIQSYNEKAKEFSAKFQSLGPRTEDIERAITLRAKDENFLSVLELGVGDGRDAKEIVKRVSSYVGVEPSEGLLAIAIRDNPGVQFVRNTAQQFVFPANVDIIFASASLLHINQADMRDVLQKSAESLTSGGIVYLSLKEANVYTPRLDIDQWGERQFYLYSVSDIVRLAGSAFEVVYESHQTQGETPWFTLALKKA